MSYIDDLADAIRKRVPPEALPDGDTAILFRLYAVLALAKGERVVLEDIHDAWAAWIAGQEPAHRALEPLSELPADIQRADEPYLASRASATLVAEVPR